MPSLDQLLASLNTIPVQTSASAFAPSNIALIKYWGKRDLAANLPMTDSLSIALGHLGAKTTLVYTAGATAERSSRLALTIAERSSRLELSLNGSLVAIETEFYQRIWRFLERLGLLAAAGRWQVLTESNIPIAAGLASSACGFAALVLALAQILAWQLTDAELSQLARLGSGSAARSLWPGLVHWHRGVLADGSDCYAEPLAAVDWSYWQDLCIGILIVADTPKKQGSTAAMQLCQQTSPLYPIWPEVVAQDLRLALEAIRQPDFEKLAQLAESNALAMHAVMQASRPSICYSKPETLVHINQVWQLREQGKQVYFTQDAGPNLKLLFRAVDREAVLQVWPDLLVVQPGLSLFTKN